MMYILHFVTTRLRSNRTGHTYIYKSCLGFNSHLLPSSSGYSYVGTIALVDVYCSLGWYKARITYLYSIISSLSKAGMILTSVPPSDYVALL
jgi:hypothetical protein